MCTSSTHLPLHVPKNYTTERLFWIDYPPPPQSQNNVVQGAQMNEECHIWMSVCAVLTSTWYNHFQWIQLMVVHCNIETTTHDMTQNHPIRVYIFHPSIHLTSIVNLFTCFQLDIDYYLCYLKKIFKFRCHFIICKINDGWFFDNNPWVS